MPMAKKARFSNLLKTNGDKTLDSRATLKILTTRTQRRFRVKLDLPHDSAKSIAMRDTFTHSQQAEVRSTCLSRE